MLLGVLDQVIRMTREVLDVVLFAFLLMMIVIAFEGAHSWRARAARYKFGLHLGVRTAHTERGRKAA